MIEERDGNDGLKIDEKTFSISLSEVTIIEYPTEKCLGKKLVNVTGTDRNHLKCNFAFGRPKKVRIFIVLD